MMSSSGCCSVSYARLHFDSSSSFAFSCGGSTSQVKQNATLPPVFILCLLSPLQVIFTRTSLHNAAHKELHSFRIRIFMRYLSVLFGLVALRLAFQHKQTTLTSMQYKQFQGDTSCTATH